MDTTQTAEANAAARRFIYTDNRIQSSECTPQIYSRHRCLPAIIYTKHTFFHAHNTAEHNTTAEHKTTESCCQAMVVTQCKYRWSFHTFFDRQIQNVSIPLKLGVNTKNSLSIQMTNCALAIQMDNKILSICVHFIFRCKHPWSFTKSGHFSNGHLSMQSKPSFSHLVCKR